MNHDATSSPNEPTLAAVQWLPLLTLLLALAGCSTSPASPGIAPSPLEGRIFDTASNRELGPAGLDARLMAAEVIYLGETHDEPAHHEAQLQVLHRLVNAGHPPAVGFEMFATDQSATLQEYLRRTAGADAWLRQAVGWSAPDSPNWEYYGALLRYAHSAKLELFGMDLDGGLVRKLTRVGLAGLDASERARLESSGLQDPLYRKVMLDEFAASHCGHADQTFLDHLYDTWVARNDSMARAIVARLNAAPTRPVVAILGLEHTSWGMGVVARVAHLRPGTRQLNIGLRAAIPDATRPEDYFGESPAAAPDYPPSHEIVWITRSTPGRPTVAERCARAFPEHERQ